MLKSSIFLDKCPSFELLNSCDRVLFNVAKVTRCAADEHESIRPQYDHGFITLLSKSVRISPFLNVYPVLLRLCLGS